MKFPKHLEKGGTIGIAAPSFGAATEPYKTRFAIAVKQFKELGYNVKIGDCCTKSDGLGISTSPHIAAKELEQFYLDDSIDVIISCGGGELMCEVMSYIDFDKIKNAKPKWFMGYSDNTNFIFPLVTMCDTAAIYGPCVSTFAKPWEQSESDAWNLLTGKSHTVKGYDRFQNPQSESEDILARYVLDEEKILKSYVPSISSVMQASVNADINFSGVLTGGCLDVLAMHCGTKFDNVKDFNKKHSSVIWVFEACDLSPMDIRRSLWTLREAGWFTSAKGFIIGRPLAAFRQNMMGVDQYNAVIDIIKDLNVPVIMDADIGHIDPAMPLIFGSQAKVNVKGNSITIDMAH